MSNKWIRLIVFFLSVFSEAYARDPFLQPESPHETSVIRWVKLHYANAEEMVHWLKAQQALIDKVVVGSDEINHTVWLKGDPHQVNMAAKLCQSRDRVTPQVFIVARIVSISKGYRQYLGVSWNTRQSDSQKPDGLQMNFPNSEDPRSLDITIADLGFGKLLDLSLSAMEHEGYGKVMASPQLLIGDGKTASIESGQSIPYHEHPNKKTSAVNFKKAVLRLQVTPRVIAGNRIHLMMTLIHDKPNNLYQLGAPVISTESLETNVEVAVGQTIVLGGIYENKFEHGQKGLPFLSKIPFLGQLFREDDHIEDTRELIIFVTPTLSKLSQG